ncbi:hypothetical protein TUN199_02643 [Pyrenophora tritici-repentis]|uniref:Uncharacterized protein n=1 Tax=Pyrenophora tritici-repentis TaxID=45151 RepID=A0A834VPZ2_9PLEO|nr:hypothetical protein PtrM4_075210 [Pyrenophora tritici-repentis]KAI0625341.1 hypothetical protein TUN199_02643 [Pyrenophora tritici-repentis]
MPVLFIPLPPFIISPMPAAIEGVAALSAAAAAGSWAYARAMMAATTVALEN